MKEYAKKTYAKKGDKIVEMNYQAIDRGAGELKKVSIDPSWADLPEEAQKGCI